MKFVIREDDISFETDVEIVKYTHNQYLINHKVHTLAVICDGIEKNRELIRYINNTQGWDIQIHGWTHENYALLSKDRIEDDLDKCILKIEGIFGVTPDKWYLPHNRWIKEKGMDSVARIADLSIYHGVDVDVDCEHITSFNNRLGDGFKPLTNTIYFHNWNIGDLMQLPTLMYLTRLYNQHPKDFMLLENLQDLL